MHRRIQLVSILSRAVCLCIKPFCRSVPESLRTVHFVSLVSLSTLGVDIMSATGFITKSSVARAAHSKPLTAGKLQGFSCVLGSRAQALKPFNRVFVNARPSPTT